MGPQKCLAVAALLALLGDSSAVAQDVDVQQAWLGIWKLNPQRSTFAEGAPVVVRGQVLKIAATDESVIVTGDTTLRDGRRLSETAEVKRNGAPSAGPGGTVAVFKALDRDSFEIVVTVKSSAIGEGTGVNRFVFSPDGRSLVETKTQTRRPEAVPAGQAVAKAAEGGTVTSVLVFERQE